MIDIPSWMKDHHLQLNIFKTKLLIIPANPKLDHNPKQLGTLTITPSWTVRLVLYDQLNLKDYNIEMADMLYQNTIFQVYVPSRTVCFVVSSQKGTKNSLKDCRI